MSRPLSPRLKEDFVGVEMISGHVV